MPLIWIDRIRESSGCFEARVHAVIPGSKEPVCRRDRMIDTKGVNSIVNRVGDIDCVVIERPGLSGHRVVLEKVVPNIGDADCRDHVARTSGAAKVVEVPADWINCSQAKKPKVRSCPLYK